MPAEFNGLQDLLNHIARATQDRERVSLEALLEAVGLRSFAPVLLLVGIILFSPLSGIPGLPTIMAMLVLLVTVQMFMGRHHFWLPQWMLRRSISRNKLQAGLKWLGKPAAFIDRWLRPRLQFLVMRTGTWLVAAICTLIALALPVMEVVPFSASIAGIALTAFGLALVAHDGVLALAAFILTAATLLVIAINLI